MEMTLEILLVLTGFIVGVATAFYLKRSVGGSRGEAILFELIAEHAPIALLLYTDNGTIRFANQQAMGLLFQDQSLSNKNFLRLLYDAPDNVREALLSNDDALFTLEQDGEQQTFQLLRRRVLYQFKPHNLLLINPLTREVSRREIEVLKKVIRVISHELNNSLGSISSLINSGRYIIKHPEMVEQLDRVFGGVEERTQHLKKFLDDYAVMARLPKARPRYVKWQPMLDRLRDMFPEATIGQPPSEAGWFDEGQIEQALINLLKNATEAEGEASAVELIISTTESTLQFCILDRGKGFSEEAFQQGLLPFYTTKKGGTGVGLALCRDVVQEHRGSLRIKARSEGGSAVYCILPLREEFSETVSRSTITLTHT